MKKEIKNMKKEGWFPILKTGTFRDDRNREHTFTESDLKSMADKYNSQPEENFREAPITVGHPQNNSPAFGWVEKLQQAGNHLMAKAADVVPEFAEAIRLKMYKYVSPAIRPDGTLKHIGFLGGQPPAIPGLGPVSEAFGFSEDEEAAEIPFAFAEINEKIVDQKLFDIISIIGRIRDFFIDKYSMEEVNQVISPWEIDNLQTVSVIKKDEGSVYSESKNDKKKEVVMNLNQEDLDKAVQKKEQEVAAQFSEKIETEKKRADKAEAELAAGRLAVKKEEVSNFVERMKAEGRILPKQAEGVINFLMKLDDAEAFSFSEGSEKETGRKFFMKFLEGLPVQVPAGKLKSDGSESNESSDFAETNVDDGSLDLRNRAMARAEREKISFEEALEKERR